MAEEDDLIGEAEDTVEAGTPEETKGTDDEDVLDAGGESGNKDAGDLLSGDEDAETGEGGDGETIDYTFTPPEGTELSEDQTAALDAFKATAQDLGLSQDQFQRIIEMDLQRSQDEATAAVDAYTARISEWREEAKTDSVIGGEQYQSSLKKANAVLAQFADKEFIGMLRSPSQENVNGFGIGNHAATIRFLNKVAAALADPKLLTGADETPPQRTADDVTKSLYPTMAKKTA
jgi:broad specificity phosphatase PhoE